jgi:hypothetical protein
MTKILTDLSKAALAKAVTENCYAFSPFSHNWKGAEIYAGSDVNWVVTDIPFAPSNCAFHTNLTPENADAAIEKFKAKGREKNVPLGWYICQDTRPKDFGKILEAHGFASRGEAPGMAIDLQAMNENVPVPEGLEIIEVKDDKELRAWCHVVCAGFGAPPQAEPTFVKLFQTEIEYKQPMRFFLGLFDGQPVSSSMSFLAEGVVGIYMVATLPEARKKGAAYTVTQKALREGRSRGYRVGVLQASKMGEPVYKRMGFNPVCRVSDYQWSPENYRDKPEGA